MQNIRLERWMICTIALASVVSLLLAASAPASERFVAQFTDGKRLEVDQVPFWPLPSGNAKWAGHELFGKDSPRLELLRDREVTRLLRPPYLVLANGDVLPGTAVQLEPGGLPGEPLRVRVQLESPLMPLTGATIAVRADRIARLVVSESFASDSNLPPGAVVLSSGRKFVARSLRWRETALSLLTSEGIVEVDYRDIGEAVLPGVDLLESVLDDHQTDREGACIVRYALANGAVLTAARAGRRVEQSRARSRVVTETYYLAQPAWTTQPIKFSAGEIAWCGYRRADEVPLSLLPAETIVNRRLIAEPRPWLRNQTFEGTILSCGGREGDLGLSVHSHSELSFILPPESVELSTLVGLDVAVQDGGCVRCKVLAESGSPRDKPRVIWDSGILRGSDGVKETGSLDVAGMKRVRLVTEFAHDDRPPGADPLDIRDQVCWLTPLVTIELDGARKVEMLRATLPGASAWEIAEDGGKDAYLTSIWNDDGHRWDPRLCLAGKSARVSFSRKLKVTPAVDVVELFTGCPAAVEQHDFELQVNGEPLAWHASADRKQIVEINNRLLKAIHKREASTSRYKSRTPLPDDTLVYWWDLQAWRGQEVTLSLVLRGQTEQNDITWRGLNVRSAIANLPAEGHAIEPQTLLTDLTPTASSVPAQRNSPTKNGVPPGKVPDPIRFLGQHFANGFGFVRSSSATFALDPSYKRFVAVAGCCTDKAGPLRVLVDGRVIWERPLISALSPAEQIDLPLPAGAKTLTLEVGSDGGSGGKAAWANAGFMK
jgi:hypothetical protein